MKRRVKQALSLCLAAGLLLSAGGMSTFAAEEVLPEETEETEAEPETEKSLVGELVFAQCEDFINIRNAADADAEVTAKIFNNGSAEVVAEENGWIKITSGSAEGYAKADYFVSGDEAKAIAEEVAYNVARIQVEELVVRLEPSTESEAIASVYQDEEIEVVLYGDDWMKVALDLDTYGYVQADYVEYITYYPTAKTLAELEAEEAGEDDSDEEEDLYEEEFIEEDSYEEESYEENIYVEETYVYETEAAVAETEAATEDNDDEANVYYADASSIEYDFYYDADEGVYVTIEDGEITTFSDTSASATESAAEEEEAVFFEDPDEYYGTSEESESTSKSTTSSSSSDSSVGESIVSYASEFLGNSYVYGGTSLTDGCDCSGFVQSVYANFDIDVSRTAEEQAASGTAVDTDDLQVGDLLFYSSDGETIDHVAIYTGDNTIIHASNEDRGIVTDYADYDTIVSAVRYY